jgi:AsmA protein
MKAFGKILGLVLLGLLLIIVALGFALTHLFDPNDYKDEIRQMARDKAHIELTLNGDIGWSLFPWLGLELHEASIATLNNPRSRSPTCRCSACPCACCRCCAAKCR